MAFPVCSASHTTARSVIAGVHSTLCSSHGVLIRVSSAAAARSRYTAALRWPCRNVAATSREISPSTARRTIAALCSPVAIRAISLAPRMVATPIVIASRGTLSSPKKSAAASFRVTVSSVTRRVRESGGEPGSLKPMWPLLPMPRIWKSMPPASPIARSYAAQCSSSRSRGVPPSGMCTFSGRMFTWANRFSHM